MDLKLLEYIVAIADFQNVTKAADSLYISQSGLNQQLIKAEKDLGVALFYRSKKAMIPTPAGQLYVQNARVILKLAQNTITQIKDLNNNPSGDIFFGLPFEHGTDLFIDISPDFTKKFPNYTIHLQEQTVHAMEEKIKKNQMDLAFIMRSNTPSSDFKYEHLCTEKLVLGVPAKSWVAQYAAPAGKPLNTIDLSQLKNENFALMFFGSTMRVVIDPMFERAGYHPIIHYETLMNNTLCRLVSKGLCCTILPQSYAKKSHSTAWFYLEDDPHWEWYIIYSKTRVLSMGDQYLIQLAKNYSEKMEQYWQMYGIGMPTAD